MSHSIQCIYYIKKEPEEFVDESFHKDRLEKTYRHFIKPVNGSTLWPRTRECPLNPPTLRRPPGRPKRQRRRDVDEEVPSSRTRRKVAS